MVHRAYRIGGVRFGLRTNSESFGAWVDEVLASYRVRLRNDAFYYSIVVGGDDRSYNILYKGTVKEVRTLELPTLAAAFISDLESFLLHSRRDAIYTLSTLVSLNGSSALVPSFVGAQLTGLGRRLQQCGVTVRPAPAVAIDRRTGDVVPIRPRVRVPSDPLERLIATAPPNGERNHEHQNVSIVCTISDGNGVRCVAKGAALYDLASRTANLGRLGGRALEGIRSLLDRADCYALPYDRPQRMLDSLVEVLGEAR